MRPITHVDLIQSTKIHWNRAKEKHKDKILTLRFVKSFAGARLHFEKGYTRNDVQSDLEKMIRDIIRPGQKKVQLRYFLEEERPLEKLTVRLVDKHNFKSLDFGGDVAEQDENLSQYFFNSRAFERVKDGKKSIVIGAKGSGKSAILRELVAISRSGHSVVITPEVFATSMLRQFVEDSGGSWDEDESFVATWIFTILVEVFKRLCAGGRGIPEKFLKDIRKFLRENSKYQDMDIFTRFIGYLKRIESVKLGDYELTLKTRMLQDLYALEPLYALVPGLRKGMKQDIVILIDELDQGWDNSAHANRFLASLLQATTRIQQLGLRITPVVFIRSEIFDLVKSNLGHLDKLRSSIETLRWTPGELYGLLLKRIDFCLKTQIPHVEREHYLLDELFPEPCRGVNGIGYIVSRTTRRPREVLQFATHAHQIAVENGENWISSSSIMQAEEDFSTWKLEHLCAEYLYVYPNLRELLSRFRGIGPVLSLGDCHYIVEEYFRSEDEGIPAWTEKSVKRVLQVLFSVDFLGVERRSPVSEGFGTVDNYEFAYTRPSANLTVSESVIVHPVFWSSLEMEHV